jgi:hypothetical protein
MKKPKNSPTRVEAKHCSGCAACGSSGAGSLQQSHSTWENCRVVPLSKMRRVGTPKEGLFMFSQHLCSYQTKFPDGKCIEAATGQRGGIPEIGGRPFIYDVAIHPGEATPKAVRQAFLAVVGEKAFHDACCYGEILNRMVTEGRMTEEEAAEAKVDPISLRKKVVK